jgi:hypothetical protein
MTLVADCRFYLTEGRLHGVERPLLVPELVVTRERRPTDESCFITCLKWCVRNMRNGSLLSESNTIDTELLSQVSEYELYGFCDATNTKINVDISLLKLVCEFIFLFSVTVNPRLLRPGITKKYFDLNRV